MIYFKNSDSDLYAFDDNAPVDAYAGLIPLTAEDYAAMTAPSLPVLREQAARAINTIRDARIYAGVEFPPASGQMFETDEKSQLKIAGAVTMAMLAAQAGVVFEQPWILQDNSTVTLSGAMMMVLGQAVGAHVGAHTVQARSYKNQIANATDRAAIDAVVAAYTALEQSA